MAYIPDQAFTDIQEVGHKAFQLFAFYCKHASMSHNQVFVSLESAASFLGLAYENTCRLNAVLKKNRWIQVSNGITTLLKGYVKTDENISLPPRKPVKKLTKTSVLDVKTDENISFECQETSENQSKTDENISSKLTKTSVAYKEEPAQGTKKKKSNLVRLPKKEKGSRISEDFYPDEKLLEWIHKNAPPELNITHEIVKFIGYWTNNTTAKAIKPRWDLAFKNWILNAIKFEEKNATNQRNKPDFNEANNGYNRFYQKHNGLDPCEAFKT